MINDWQTYQFEHHFMTFAVTDVSEAFKYYIWTSIDDPCFIYVREAFVYSIWKPIDDLAAIDVREAFIYSIWTSIDDP